MKRHIAAVAVAIVLLTFGIVGIATAATYYTTMYAGQNRQLWPKRGYTIVRYENYPQKQTFGYFNKGSFWVDTYHVFKPRGCSLSSSQNARTFIWTIRCR